VIIEKRDTSLQYSETSPFVLVRFTALRHRRCCRGGAAGTLLSRSATPQWASFPQALHRVACVISVMLHGRRNYNPHSRARHPAV